MDIDPLADSSPARHIIESDDEDDMPLFRDPETPIAVVRIEGQMTTARTMIFATGKAAFVWARGVRLGEQIGAVIVNDVRVGMVFKPSWSDATIILSETFARLPLWAMHPYVEALCELVRPERVFALDSYPSLTYIASARPLPVALRYLCNESAQEIAEGLAVPFSPPNLVQGTSAALLLNCHMRKAFVFLILLPSFRVIPQSPSKVIYSNLDTNNDEDFSWPQADMHTIQILLAKATQDPLHPWQPTIPNESLRVVSRHRDEESNLYI